MTISQADPRYDAAALRAYAADLLKAGGLDEDKAGTVAAVLVEGDLLGHDTHGLALLPAYLDEISKGSMRTEGAVEVLRDSGAAAVWNAHRLPGPWVIAKAVEHCLGKARETGTATVAIRRSHHIACLAAYLKTVTDAGCVGIIASSDPAVESVAPHGGTRRIITPNPLAAGLPTSGDPMILDISMSTTTNGMVARMLREGRPLPHAWILDGHGRATADPAAYSADPPGSILPLGGTELGYKGFGLGLLVEALTAGLSGHGRADEKEGWGATVFVQVMDPEWFAGLDAFRRQMDHLVAEIADNPPVSPGGEVRVPGHNGLRRRARQRVEGVRLHPSVLPSLEPWTTRLSVAPPLPVV